MNTLVMITDHKAVTTSLIIANAFEKQHKNILQSIERLECSTEFGRLNFQPSSYQNEQNKLQPMYHITRDGFTFLTMGFTGPKAERFKEAFIAEFNRMEQELREPLALTLLQLLTGVNLNDIIDKLTGANRTPTPAPKPRHYPPCFNSHN